MPPPAVRIVLASASPARRATLASAGISPEVNVSGVDETAFRQSDPAELAVSLAVAKATAVAGRPEAADALVIGCDSVLELDGKALGKPRDARVATKRWKSMRGRSATLLTGHCVVDTRTGRSVDAVARTTVTFAEVTDAEIAAYVATGEPLHVAGAFTIDGLGGAFVTEIAGDPHNVVGISLPLVRVMLAELDVAWTDLWAGGSATQPGDPSRGR